MTASPGDLTGHSLLAVFAHPDDESIACGGLLAWCAARGASTSLVCATRGEAGAGSDPALATTRMQELEAAARILGLSDLCILDRGDGMLPWVDAAALETDIRNAIARFRPEVVVTFGEDGLYWHPDHIALYNSTTAAVQSLGPSAPALYYVTMPAGSMRAVIDTVAARHPMEPFIAMSILGISDVDAFGAGAAAPTLVLDVSEFAARKLQALKCHRSQVAGTALDTLSEDDARHLLATEHFRRAETAHHTNTFIERFGAPAFPAPAARAVV